MKFHVQLRSFWQVMDTWKVRVSFVQGCGNRWAYTYAHIGKCKYRSGREEEGYGGGQMKQGGKGSQRIGENWRGRNQVKICSSHNYMAI